VTVNAPPRPHRPSDPVTHGEFDALVEALIEEARQRGQRRRRRNAAVVTLVTLVGVAVFALLGRSAQSQTASPALSVRSSLPAAAASSKIAFIREPPRAGYAGVLWVMNPDGSGQRRLAPAFPGMRWSPDGQKVAFAAIVDLPDRLSSDIYVMNADGSGQRELTPDDAQENSPAWSPDGRRIAFLSSGIRVVNADGGGLRRLTRKGWGDSAPAWSHDGRRIAFVSRRDGNVEIYVMNADGSGQRRLTRNVVRDSDPVWSPDGRRIAFESNWQIYVMNADGSGQRRLTRNGARNFAPAWSPDGQRIAFERRVGREEYGSCSGCGRASTFQVYVINADGTRERMLAQDGTQPSWSPDSQKIAFERNLDIYVMNADGSGQRKLTRGADREFQPVWSPAQK
jgi:Tol biopolymer transport system component